MAVTETHKSPLNTVRMATGRIIDTGTVASTFPVDVELGFTPRYVCVENLTSGDKMEWYEGMTAATAVKTVAAGTRTILSSLGVTVTATGFKIGLDLDVVVTSEQVTWMALG